MESVKEKDPPQTAAPKKIMVQGMVDRDVYFLFRDLLASHKLTTQAGLAWAMRSLLVQAGVKVRADRGQRTQDAGGDACGS
jgi:hypothetical protein